ncbi:MAG: glycosyltransferase family 39 protein [Deltaproteobacteria bacterium]|nr:glycosyltransferase family 39 protein [Deltaproteobacteria bacterium]
MKIRSPYVWPVVACLLALFFYTAGLGWPPLLDWDENIFAEVSRNMAAHGEYLNMTVNGQPFVEKPPLFFWEMAAFFRVFGVSEWTARLPSALNGLLLLGVLWGLGRRLGTRIGAPSLGFFWPVVYGFSVIPFFLSRSASIDQTFTLFITLGAYGLVLYEDSYRRFRQNPEQGREYPVWLGMAALAMGLAVLTKGPLGGVIPLAAWGVMRLAAGEARFHPGHILVLAMGSLSVVAAWVGANFLAHGEDFLLGFTRFQGQLFSGPLDGHVGPVYYHFAVALVGMFPFSPLLLLYTLSGPRRWVWGGQARNLAVHSLGWAGFVLVLFSLVQTKLPHYSSSMYVPLSLLAALALAGLAEQNRALPRWIGWVMALYGLLLGGVFMAAPYLLEGLAAREGVLTAHPPQPQWWDFWPGALLALGVACGGWLAAGGRWPKKLLKTDGSPHQAGLGLKVGVLTAALAVGGFGVGAYRIHLPRFAEYNQGTVISMMEEAYRNQGRLALYKTLSFAVMFYGKQNVEVIGSYKFTGDETRLDEPGVYVIAPQTEEGNLLKAHPRLKPVRREGRYGLYRQPGG